MVLSTQPFSRTPPPLKTRLPHAWEGSIGPPSRVLLQWSSEGKRTVGGGGGQGWHKPAAAVPDHVRGIVEPHPCRQSGRGRRSRTLCTVRESVEREGGRQGCIRRGGGVGWDPPSSQGKPMVPAEGGPKILKLQCSWHRSKILAVSLKHWKGRSGGGGGAPPPSYVLSVRPFYYIPGGRAWGSWSVGC